MKRKKLTGFLEKAAKEYEESWDIGILGIAWESQLTVS